MQMPRLCTSCTHPARATIDDGLVTGQSLRAISAAYGVSKSAVDRHKDSHLPAALAQDDADLRAEFQAARQADQQRSKQLCHNARAVMRAFEGWGPIQTVEEWQRTCADARQRYESGRFLIERLGGERFLDPQCMATLWQLRQGLLEVSSVTSPAMTMVIDLAVMSYANALRIQGWIGDVALWIEHELFAENALKVKLRQQYGTQFDGFAVEEHLQRLREQLLPIFERMNRQVLQNLQALQRPTRGTFPAVAIGRAGQVHVAQQRVHLRRNGGRASPADEPRGLTDASQTCPPPQKIDM
jgi:hypothetical protein